MAALGTDTVKDINTTATNASGLTGGSLIKSGSITDVVVNFVKGAITSAKSALNNKLAVLKKLKNGIGTMTKDIS